MNEQLKRDILEKIKSYQRIVVSRHQRPDGDAVGSTKGFVEMLRLSFPEKEILLINDDYCDYMQFLGGEDEQTSEEFYRDALLIVLDTGNKERVSNKHLEHAKEIIKIDHHIDTRPYGDISWVEDFRSSACEMVVDFFLSFPEELKMNKQGATYLYAGMVTDSGRFKFSSTSGETMRCAAALLDFGVDTDVLFAHLYLKDFVDLKFQSHVFSKMKITENGVAYIFVSRAMQKKFSLTSEQASASVSHLDSIKGSLIWLAFIENDDGSIRVRLRSRFVTINTIAEKYHGGGHACASGATVYSKKEMKALLSDADAHLKDYKANQEGWL
ncbi:MAG: bifunctional oligoribonuclease/PAP phosphatase NrnA [Clostridia bacterium]|nr:bifunctional oligoribonuclease/PAP phosphatase NrnA [Clostridia bacterium]